MTGPLKTLTGLYWRTRHAWLQSRVFGSLRQALLPLWVARRSLDKAVRARAGCARGWMLDIGCGGQPYRPLFGRVERYIGMDLPPNAKVDLTGDALHLPFADASFDTVLCNQVLEHVPTPQRLLTEAARVLKPGGALLLTTPQVWGLHHEPHDYFRFTRYGLAHLARSAQLEVQDITPTTGLCGTLVQRLADTLAYGVARHWPSPAFFVLCLLLWPILLLGYALDLLLGRHGDTLDNVMLARKPHPSAARQPRQPAQDSNPQAPYASAA